MMKLPKENIDIGNILLNKAKITRETASKTDKWVTWIWKASAGQMKLTTKWIDSLPMGENLCQVYLSQGVSPRLYKELRILNTEKKNTKWQLVSRSVFWIDPQRIINVQ